MLTSAGEAGGAACSESGFNFSADAPGLELWCPLSVALFVALVGVPLAGGSSVKPGVFRVCFSTASRFSFSVSDSFGIALALLLSCTTATVALDRGAGVGAGAVALCFSSFGVVGAVMFAGRSFF